MPKIQSTKVPEIRWYCKPPYSAVDQLRLIGGLRRVNTMSQFEGNNFWYLGIRLKVPAVGLLKIKRRPLWPNEGRQCQNLLGYDYWVLARTPGLKTVGFGDLVRVDIAPVSKKWLLSTLSDNFYSIKSNLWAFPKLNATQRVIKSTRNLNFTDGPNQPNLRFYFTPGLYSNDFVGGCQDVVGEFPFAEKLGRHDFIFNVIV